MKRSIFFVCAATLLLIAVAFLGCYCQWQEQAKVPFSVEVPAGEGTVTVDCWRAEDGAYYVFLPSWAELSGLQIQPKLSNMHLDGTAVDQAQPLDDVRTDTAYDLSFRSCGVTRNSTVTFVQSDGMPAVYLETETGSMDYIHGKKGNEEAGSMQIYLSDGSRHYDGQLSSICGRGNSTWENYDKKSYNLKLETEADLLSMGQAQRWVLLSNATDASGMRNKIVYDFAAEVGLAYTPQCQWVDLYLNDRYAGLYLLCERIELHPQRVNVSGDDCFLVSQEIESRLVSENASYITTDSGQVLDIRAASIDASQLVALWQTTENAILSPDGTDSVSGKTWKECIDISSWAKKYLIEEIFGSLDAGFASQYFYSDGEKIYAGPVWDYDSSMGRTWQMARSEALFANRLQVKSGVTCPWYPALCQKPEFYERVTELYRDEFRPLLVHLLEEKISIYQQQTERAMQLEQLRWPREETAPGGSIQAYMTDRMFFLDSLWLEQTPYCIVRADNGTGANYAHYAVQYGQPLEILPMFEEEENFLGWYYSDTDMPVDLTAPVLEDLQIYGKWSTIRTVNGLEEAFPLGILALMFTAVVVFDVIRMKRNG